MPLLRSFAHGSVDDAINIALLTELSSLLAHALADIPAAGASFQREFRQVIQGD
jgi:hypothetical protein